MKTARIAPTSVARTLQALSLTLGLALAAPAAHAEVVNFNFTVNLTTPAWSTIWINSLTEGFTTGLASPSPTQELADLRSANPTLTGSFGWDTAAAGQNYPWASHYTGSLNLNLQQQGQAVTVSNTAAGVDIVNNGSYGDTLSVNWQTWPNSFNSGILDITAAQPVETRIDLNQRGWNTGLQSLPVHVLYSDLHFAQLQVRLDDTSGQALSSNQLPGTLSLQAFSSSSLDLTFVGHTTTEVRREDFASDDDYAAAQAWVAANVGIDYVQVAFTGVPFASLTTLTSPSAVPEPATWALAALGLLGTLGAARRRRD